MMNWGFTQLLGNVILLNRTQNHQVVSWSIDSPNVENIPEHRLPCEFALKCWVHADLPCFFVVNESDAIVASQKFVSFRKYNFMRVWDRIWRINTKLGLVISTPSINCAVFFAFNIALLQLNHESLLNFNIDNTQNVFHVFFVHVKKCFSRDLFWLKYIDVVLVPLFVAPFNQIFCIPFLSELSSFLNCEKVFCSVDNSIDLFVFETLH